MRMIRSAATRCRNTGLGAAALGALLLSTVLPHAAQAQSNRGPFSLFDNIFSGSAPPQAAVPPAPGSGGVQPWSGEDGASGHPLMTAQAIRDAANNFDNCLAGLWPDAARRGISQESFERFTAGLTPDLRIMDLMDSQPEFTKAIWDYLDILVNDTRLARGREVLAKYKTQFDAAERAYGVDRYIIAAIWGIESNYSTQMGDRNVLRCIAATCAPNRCGAPGPAPSARPSSCPPPSSASPWTATATDAATWSTIPPT
jgi:membrane-bound lytic murein transglycosylase B